MKHWNTCVECYLDTQREVRYSPKLEKELLITSPHLSSLTSWPISKEVKPSTTEMLMDKEQRVKLFQLLHIRHVVELLWAWGSPR